MGGSLYQRGKEGGMICVFLFYFVIGGIVGRFLYLLFTAGFFGFLKDFFYSVVHKIRTCFFPDEFQKRVTDIIDSLKISDAYLAEIIRRRDSFDKNIQLYPEAGNDNSCGGASVKLEPDAETFIPRKGAFYNLTRTGEAQ
jgi:hypothetical protein